MKAKRLIKIICLSFVAASLDGCIFKKRSYEVYWLDWNGSILELDRDVPRKSNPEFNGKTPQRATDDAAIYTFKGWDKEFKPVKSEQRYTAVYEATPRKYRITWLNYDDSILEEDDVEYGKKPEYKGETPRKPSTLLTDYTFSKWDRPITEVKESKTYKAMFDVSNFEPVYLSYKLNKTKHEVSNSNPTTLRKGSKITLSEPSAKGYDFVGWYLDEDYSVKIETPLSNLNHDLTIYGKFEPHVYSISYNTSGGQLAEEEVNITSITCEAEPFELYKPTKVGYGFNTWRDSKGREYTVLEDVCEDLNLSAVFDANTYTITFKYKDKSDEHVQIKYDQKINYPVLTKKGYKFLGWYNYETDEKFEDVKYTLLDNLILYPKWEGPISYNITYKLNGGVVDGEEPTQYSVDSFPTLIEPTREGYDFAGWYLNKKEFTSFRDLAEDLELSAKWTPHKVSISFDYDGGTLRRSVDYKDGETIVESKLVSPFEGGGFVSLEDKANAQFKGWKNEKGQFISFAKDVEIESDVVLSATWANIGPGVIGAKVGEEINFNTDGSSTHTYQFTSLYKQTVSFSFEADTYIVASITNENKSPMNGGKQSKYSKEFTLSNVQLEANTTYFLTIYATGDGKHAVKVNSEVTSDVSNVQNGVIKSKVYTIDTTTQLYDEKFVTPGTPVKEGMVFAGWADEENVVYDNDTVLKKESISLHAVWANAE